MILIWNFLLMPKKVRKGNKKSHKKLTQTWVWPVDIFGEPPQALGQWFSFHNYQGQREIIKYDVINDFFLGSLQFIHQAAY